MKEEKVIQLPEMKIAEDDFEVEFAVEFGFVTTEKRKYSFDRREQDLKKGLFLPLTNGRKLTFINVHE